MANYAACGGCSRTWQAAGQAHCKACHTHFNSDSAFFRHRVGKWSERRCLTAPEFSEPMGKKRSQPRLVPIEHPDGTIWATARRKPAEAQIDTHGNALVRESDGG